jgi:hypothetical protein
MKTSTFSRVERDPKTSFRTTALKQGRISELFCIAREPKRREESYQHTIKQCKDYENHSWFIFSNCSVK